MTARSRSSEFAVLAVALGALALHLACGNRYGFFRDELYFVACGQHLAWGYVDQPPLIALVARMAWWMSGHGASVWLFRLPAMLAHAGTVMVAGALARRLGAGAFGAVLAALLTALAPIQLAQGQLLTMNVFELLLWASVAFALVVALQGDARGWIAAGALLGLALLTKYSAAFLAVTVLLGLVATPARRNLGTRPFLVALMLAAALALPSFLWQLRHGLPFLELLENGRAHKNAAIPLGDFAKSVFLEEGPFGVLVALFGLGWLLASRHARPFRALGIAFGGVLALMVALHAKPYYLAPAVTPLFAAGSAALDRTFARSWQRGLALALGPLTALVAIPIVIPLLPLPQMLAWQRALGVTPPHLERLRYTDVPQHFADQFGWHRRVAAVERVVGSLPPAVRQDAVIFTTNYGRAASLQLFGHDLPQVICGHNQYFLWGVPGAPRTVIALGGDTSDYARDFGSVRQIGQTPAIPEGMPYESEIPIYLLEAPRAPVGQLFASAKHYE